MRIITGDDIARVANWPMIISALREGHRLAPAELADSLVENGGRKMLVRTAWIPGLASGVKAVTIYPDNPGHHPPAPSVQGQVLLFDEARGNVIAVLEGVDLTAWKTAGDSALGASYLASVHAETLFMVGAGAMALPLIEAHRTARPSIKLVMIWNRNRTKAEALCRSVEGVETIVAGDIDAFLPEADIVCSATMATEPLISGRLLKSGAHVDLVGAYTPSMREADDETMRRGRVFVDSYRTTLGHIGEVMIPIANGALKESNIAGDLHALVKGQAGRRSESEITVFKNGGGAHLDIMTAKAIYDALA